MDNLFWLLYLGDISESLQSHLYLISGLSLGFGLFAALLLSITYFQTSSTDPSSYDYEVAQKLNKLAADQRGKITKVLILGMVSLLLGAFTPSKQTIYIYVGASATIDLANKAVDSNLGKKPLKLLENKIDKALEEEMPETPEKE